MSDIALRLEKWKACDLKITRIYKTHAKRLGGKAYAAILNAYHRKHGYPIRNHWMIVDEETATALLLMYGPTKVMPFEKLGKPSLFDRYVEFENEAF